MKPIFMISRFPHESQLDIKDCGPACIKIIAKFYGRFYSLQLLRDLCGITKEGVSFLDMSFALQHIGMRAKGVKLSYSKLLTAPLPCILHWNKKHFVVLYKIKKNSFYISDPAKGLLKYNSSEIKEAWLMKKESAPVLILEPTPSFYEVKIEGSKKNSIINDKLWGYLKDYKSAFGVLFGVMFIATVLQAFLPFISKAVIDVGLQTNDIDFINLILLGNIAIIVSVLISGIVRDWVLLHVSSRLNIALISDYLIKLMKLPIQFFETKMAGDILQRAADHDRIRSFITNSSVSFIFSIFTFVVFTTILYVFDSTLFFIYLIGCVAFLFWVLFFMNMRKKLDWQYFDLNAQNQSYWVETIAGISDIKVNNYQMQKRWKWETLQAKIFKVNQNVLTISNAQNLGGQFLNQLTNLLVTFYSAKAVVSGKITFGVMISTQFIIGQLNGPLIQFISFIQAAQGAKVSFQRLEEIHSLDDEEESRKRDDFELPQLKSLILRNVAFQYSRNTAPVIQNITLVIPEGKVTAIVGDSGSGKTTLLKILLRLYSPSFGEFSIGNLNVTNIDLRTWRSKCGVVLQDGRLFNDTILNNIVLDDENIDHEKLIKAVSTANIGDEIEKLPAGYQTILGEQGRGVSGGQKQRILIARALYKNPDYLFLDEATNALDSINEQRIVDSLDKVFKGKTVVIVAHRLSTIKKADQIVVMNNGRIVEIGNHETLIQNKSGHYKSLVQAQIGTTKEHEYDVA